MIGHSFLDRSEYQRLYFHPIGGSKYLVYSITRKGANLITHHQPHPVAKITYYNKSTGYPYLEHTLTIADFGIALNLTIRDNENIDLIDSNELKINLPVKTQQKPKPYRLHTPVIHQGSRISVGVEPDYILSLRLKNEKQLAFFMVEIDRGTMPIERSNVRQISILRKLLAYQAIWQSKIHQQQLGWHSFRVLFIAASAERVANMVKTVNKNVLTKGSPVFLFTIKS